MMSSSARATTWSAAKRLGLSFKKPTASSVCKAVVKVALIQVNRSRSAVKRGNAGAALLSVVLR
jgi:hypothetical protein